MAVSVIAVPGSPTAKTGSLILVVPGDPAQGFELDRAPDSGGSPGTYATIAGGNVDGIHAPASGLKFFDPLPAGPKVWYRYRHKGGGLLSGAYSSAIQVTPSLQQSEKFPRSETGLGRAGVTVSALAARLGAAQSIRTVTIQVPQGAFSALRAADNWTRNSVGGYSHPNVITTFHLAAAMIPNLLDTDNVTKFRARMWKNAAADTCQCLLQGQKDDGTMNSRGTATLAATGAWTTQEVVMGGSEFIVGTEALRFTLNFKSTTSIADARIVWAEIDVEREELF